MAKRFFLTTAIDYPNSRPHIGTAFEKIGADVQARYRRMEGYEVFFLMGNDEILLTTYKVKHNAQLHLPLEGQPPKGTLWDYEKAYRRQTWVATQEKEPIQQVHHRMTQLPINRWIG